MSDSTLLAALAATLIGTAWMLPMGVIRLLAYRSGDVDHHRGMRNIAVLSLTLGCIFAVASLVLALMIASR